MKNTIRFLLLSLMFMSLFLQCNKKQNETTDKKNNSKQVVKKKEMTEAQKTGKMVFAAKTCTICHVKFGQGDTLLGTDLKDVMKRRKEAWVRKWLLDTKDVKNKKGMLFTDPTILKLKKKFKVHMYKIPLKPDELNSIIDYLKYQSQ